LFSSIRRAVIVFPESELRSLYPTIILFLNNMRFISSIAAVAAVALVQAGPVLDERGIYEQPGVISVGAYISETTSTMDLPMAMSGGSQPMTPEAIVANVAPTTALSAAVPCRTQYVVVGGTAGLTYTPEFIFAEIGEVVIFHFGTKNHTFTQSTFAEPCVSMSSGTHIPSLC
jgi:hypothetical protein